LFVKAYSKPAPTSQPPALFPQLVVSVLKAAIVADNEPSALFSRCLTARRGSASAA
jgi:hypothetical protein